MDQSTAPILLIEGDHQEEDRIVHAFEKTGRRNRLLVARTAENAMTLLRACARGLAFRLVLLDAHLPRLGAGEFLRHLRKDPTICGTPVVVMGRPDDADEVLQKEGRGAEEWVRKPARIDELKELLNHLLERWIPRIKRP